MDTETPPSNFKTAEEYCIITAHRDPIQGQKRCFRLTQISISEPSEYSKETIEVSGNRYIKFNDLLLYAPPISNNDTSPVLRLLVLGFVPYEDMFPISAKGSSVGESVNTGRMEAGNFLYLSNDIHWRLCLEYKRWLEKKEGRQFILALSSMN